jgi:hypothetical protein
MILIAHRGNFEGANKETENTYAQVRKAWKEGFDVEVDVWWKEGQFYLGHDAPKHLLALDVICPADVLTDLGIWCHAKTPETLNQLLRIGAHCFYLAGDECTLTSKSYIWTSPDGELTPNSVAVMPEYSSWTGAELWGIAGICSDNLVDLKVK